MIDIPCVILSGGKSSRMGEDKALLPFGECSTLTQYQYNKLSKIFDNVYISSKIDKFKFLEDKNKIIFDIAKISSPMIALKSIFKKLNNDKIFIITVDTPLLLESTITELINDSNNYDITIAKSIDKTHNLCGIFTRNTYTKISQYIDQDMHKINFLVKSSNTNYKLFDDKNQFININTPSEYIQAKTT
jgi:molybdenum cofactor guanylyltransferase